MSKRRKTVQKAAHPKCMHPTGVLRRQNYGRSIHTFSGKSVQVAASLKCLMHAAWGKKQEYLEDCVQLQDYSIIGITGRQWDSSHSWSAAMAECRFFGMGR